MRGAFTFIFQNQIFFDFRDFFLTWGFSAHIFGAWRFPGSEICMLSIFVDISELIVSGLFWVVLYTQPLREKSVLDQLVSAGHIAYMPVTQNRCKNITPLFSRYIFVQNSLKLANIRSIRGFNGFISRNGEPALIRDEIIQELRNREINGLSPSELVENDYPGFLPDQIVKVMCGAHTGTFGKFNKLVSKTRAEIALSYLGSTRDITIPINSIIPAY